MFSTAAILVAGSTLLGASGGRLFAEREAERAVSRMVGAVVARVETAVGQAVETLTAASELPGLHRCAAIEVLLLRDLVFSSALIKELSVIGEEGDVRCSNLGLMASARNQRVVMPAGEGPLVFAPVAVAGPRGTALKIILRRPDYPAVSAVLPIDFLVPDELLSGPRTEIGVRIEVSGGAVLFEQRPHRADLRVMQTTQATRFPIVVTGSGAAAHGVALRNELMFAAAAVGLVMGALGGAFMILVWKRRRDDPMIEMEEALAAGEFVPYYQPLIDMETGQLAGCEVLVRWRRADGSMVPPGAFIDFAEQSGFIYPLTLALMKKAAADLGASYMGRPWLKCGFNLCAGHFNDASIVGHVETIFSSADVALTQVVLEVTERDPLTDVKLARSIIEKLQALGVRIALDDVGTGHGGMSYLLKLGVDIMKIDKLFIDSLGSERQSTAIVDSLIDLAAHLRMEVVAEGVETFEQVEALRRRGVRVAQGYVFAPALPASSYVTLVETISARPAAAATIAA